MGIERSERSGVNQSSPHHVESKPNSGKSISRSVCEQAPGRRAASNSQRRLEDSEHRGTKPVTSRASPSDCQSGDGSCRPPDILAKTFAPEFVPCRGKGSFDLHEKKDTHGGAGSESRLYSAAQPFLGTAEKKSSPRYISESTHPALRCPSETPRLNAFMCGSLRETESVALEKNQAVGTQDTPVKDGGRPSSSPGWPSGSTLPCGSGAVQFLGDRSQRTLDMLGDSVPLKQFSAASCLPNAPKGNVVCRGTYTADLPKEALDTQQGKMGTALGHLSLQNTDVLKPDVGKLSSTGPSSVCPKPLIKLTAPLTSQRDSGFDSPFASLD